MKTTLKIIKIGNSIGIVIPSHIKKHFNLNVDDLIEIEINKIEKKNRT